MKRDIAIEEAVAEVPPDMPPEDTAKLPPAVADELRRMDSRLSACIEVLRFERQILKQILETP